MTSKQQPQQPQQTPMDEPSTLHELATIKFWYVAFRGYKQLVDDAIRSPFYPMEAFSTQRPWRSTWWAMTIPTVLRSSSYMTIQYVLRYYILMQTLGIPRHHVVLIIGLTDAFISFALYLPQWEDSSSNLSQWYKHLRATHTIPSMEASHKREWWWWGPVAWYLGGLGMVVFVAAVWLGCPDYRINPRFGCSHEWMTILCFVLGSYGMQYAHDRMTIANIILDDRAVHTLEKYHNERKNQPLGMLPRPQPWWNKYFGGKQQQSDSADIPEVKDYGFVQIHDRVAEQLPMRVKRYERMVFFAVLAVAPYTAVAALELTKNSFTRSYLIMAAFFIGFMIMLTTIVHDLREAMVKEMTANKSRPSKRRQAQQGEDDDDDDDGVRVYWVELVPEWFNLGWHKNALPPEERVPTEADPLTSPTLSLHEVGRYSFAFWNLGLFQFFIEIVRGPAIRIVCLRTFDYNLTTAQLAQILTLFGITYFLMLWASEISVASRRLASWFAVTLFGVGLWSMGLSLHANGIHAAAIGFGMAEALCTGLRELVEQDYLVHDGPLGEITQQMEETNAVSAKELRAEIVYKISEVWQWSAEILVSLLLGIVGYLTTVRHASIAFGILGLGSIAFTLWFMMPTRPGFVHIKRNLLGSIHHDMKYGDMNAY